VLVLAAPVDKGGSVSEHEGPFSKPFILLERESDSLPCSVLVLVPLPYDSLGLIKNNYIEIADFPAHDLFCICSTYRGIGIKLRRFQSQLIVLCCNFNGEVLIDIRGRSKNSKGDWVCDFYILETALLIWSITHLLLWDTRCVVDSQNNLTNNLWAATHGNWTNASVGYTKHNAGRRWIISKRIPKLKL